MRIKGIDLKYICKCCYVKSIGGGRINIASTANLKNTKAYIYEDGSLVIGSNCKLENCIISVVSGSVQLLDNVIIIGEKYRPVELIVNNGHIYIDSNSKLACKRIWVRFGGQLSIGEYTNINDGSEIRCDENVSIGSFNQISYNVRIWDTNTHNILSVDERRDLTVKKYPYFGYEKSRPETAPVKIGDDCWIGERAAVLKGSDIGDGSIVGFDTLISGKKIPSYSRVINERVLKISKIH